MGLTPMNSYVISGQNLLDLPLHSGTVQKILLHTQNIDLAVGRAFQWS